MGLDVVAIGLVGGVAALGATVSGLFWHHARWVSYHRHKELPLPGRSRDVARAEAAGSAKLAWWYVRGLRSDGLRSPEQVTGRPVLCIHGYTQSGSNFLGIRAALQLQGRPSVAASLWHRLAPVSWYLLRVERALETAAAIDPAGFDVVCHSMGGVLVRAVLHRRPDLAARVGTAVTLGTPHAGTAAARGIPLLPEVQALKRSSGLLLQLPPLTTLVPRVVTIAGTLDTIVYPTSSALEDGAEHIVLATGHAGLLTDPEAIEAVLRAIMAR